MTSTRVYWPFGGPLATLVLGLSVIGLAARAESRPDLVTEEHINRSLLSAAISVGIARACPTMEVRQIYGLFKALELRNYARRLGYSDEEIEAFVESSEQQDRMKDWAIRYMTQQGVELDNNDTYCALGKYEIERKSLTGRLLRDLAPK